MLPSLPEGFDYIDENYCSSCLRTTWMDSRDWTFLLYNMYYNVDYFLTFLVDLFIFKHISAFLEKVPQFVLYQLSFDVTCTLFYKNALSQFETL